MTKRLVVLGLVVFIAACGGSNEDVDSPDSAFAESVCSSFQSLGEAKVRSGQISDDTLDPNLTAAERAEAQRQYQRILREGLLQPSATTAPDECVGKVWDRFLSEARVRSAELSASSAVPTTQPATVARDAQAYIRAFGDLKSYQGVPLPALGNSICDNLDAGQLPAAVIDSVVTYLQDSVDYPYRFGDWTRIDASFLFYGATRDMCPEHKDKIAPGDR